ncbi:helix-turn-helix transcriptional regulator [Roseivirga sp. BDSF3-8]|uniref:helix-turn-helix transcriptional regulator n=1 Tax=Roseivirga sp. BDSF3-8 TaxID=3241598 RepID=UPI0035326E19
MAKRIANNFRVNLRYLRKKHHMTQEELGEKVGKTKSLISSYEKGNVEPGLSALLELTEIFNVSLNDFVLEELAVKNEDASPEVVIDRSSLEQLKEESVSMREEYSLSGQSDSKEPKERLYNLVQRSLQLAGMQQEQLREVANGLNFLYRNLKGKRYVK